jgi:hypothetical protein
LNAHTPALSTEEIPQLTLLNYVPKIKYVSAKGEADEVEEEEGELVPAARTPSYVSLPGSMLCCLSLKADSAKSTYRPPKKEHGCNDIDCDW